MDFAKLKTGDPGQWDELWRDQYPYLRRVCDDFEETLGSGPIEEHIQETFFKLVEVLSDGRFKSYVHVRRWLRETVLNALRDEVDRVKTVKRGGGRLVSFEKFATSENAEHDDAGERTPIMRVDETLLARKVTPDEAVHRILLAADLEEALGKISPTHAGILRDDFIEDLSYKEIAKKRRISIGSVGELKRRGLNAMLVNLPARDKMLWESKAKDLETPFDQRKP